MHETIAADGRIGVTLRIGVTGHRVLDDSPTVAARVDEALTALESAFHSMVNHTAVSFETISALAEGADRLVAEVLAARGAPLHVVLPMDEDSYVADFASPASLEEFNSMMRSATHVTRLPGGPDRPASYLAAGTAIVDRADIVVAIWDGDAAAGTGGTADVVAYARAEQVPVIWIRSAAPYETLLDIAGAPAGWTGVLPLDAAALRELDAYNEWAPNRVDFTNAVTTIRSSVEGAPAGAGLHVDRAIDWIAPFFARAELHANLSQRRYMRTLTSLFVLSFLAVATAATQEAYFNATPSIVWIEVSLLLACVGAVVLARRRRLHQRWITSRYLGESLRSATYLCIAGVDLEGIGKPTRLAEDRATDTWLRRAFAETWADRPRLHPDASDVPELVQLLHDVWLGDQLRYHRLVAHRAHNRHRLLTRLAYALFGLSVAAAVLHSLNVHRGEDGESFRLWGLVSILAPAAAGALSGIGAQREFEQHSARSAHTMRRLSDIDARLSRAADLPTVQQLALEADALMRDESGQWFGVVRLHDLELPG